MKAKTIVTILIFVLLLAAIPVTIYLVKQQQEIRKRAAPATTLTLVADKQQPVVDEQFTVSVTIETGPNQVIIAEMYMTFDPTKVEAVDFVPGTFFSSPNTTGKSIDNANGRLNLTVFLPTGSTPKSGAGTVATAMFKAKAAGAATVRLTDATLVGAISEGGKNVLTGSTPVTVTVKTTTSGTTPSPTQAASVNTATPTRTPVPFESVSPSPFLSSSPSPFPTPGTGGTDISLLQLTVPASLSTVTSKRPTLTGTAKAGATVTITITGAATQTGVVTSDSSGIFSFTPSEDLTDGAQSVTLTEQAPDGSTRTATSTFTVTSTPVPTTGVVETTIGLILIATLLLVSGVILPYLPF